MLLLIQPLKMLMAPTPSSLWQRRIADNQQLQSAFHVFFFNFQLVGFKKKST